MRIAIQISGEFRMIHCSVPSLQKYVHNVFPRAEIDYFIHTWWNDCSNNEVNPYICSHGVGLHTFQPRSYYLEKYADALHLHSKSRALSMFYSIYRANESRKEYERLTETKYDIVIRYRTDCILNESLYDCIKSCIKQKGSFLIIPKSKQMPSCDGPTSGEDDENSICDWFAVGTPDTMDVYCSTYKTFESVEIPFVAESMLAIQLVRAGIRTNTVLYRPHYDFYLIDETGSIRGSAAKQSLKSPH